MGIQPKVIDSGLIETNSQKGATTTMQKMDKPVLIIGGNGKTGRRVAERLSKRGLPLRIGSRSGQPPFDWEKPDTWPEAVENVQSAYVTYYPDLGFPGAVETVRSFCEVAVSCGVRRLVLLSGRGEDVAQTSEQAVQASGAEWTIVRASWFSQNFTESHLLDPVRSGEVAFPAGNVAEPFIDADDIADVVTAALTEDKHVGELYEVTGPRLLTFAEAVAEIGAATGREIRYVPVSPEQYASALLEYGLPPGFVTPLVDLFATVLDGRNASLSDGVQRALGRQPKDFADFARETAVSGIWGEAKSTDAAATAAPVQ
jgi:uncharacterized protein YbjT (DUF2867 family)